MKPVLKSAINPLGNKKILNVLSGQAVSKPPFWFMRQAGRYLPEYRQTRAQAGSFLDLCFNPALATEVTLQPLRRFDPDAAILFSDILVVPLALGQQVGFVEGEGPKLGALEIEKLGMERFHQKLEPVYETVSRISGALDDKTALIGFAGAPWTVASYMVEGGSSREFIKVKKLAFEQPEIFARLIDLLTNSTAQYLCRQVEAGAEVLQIFDSWAGVLPPPEFQKWVIAPTKKIVSLVRAAHPDIPIIGFPKGAGILYEDHARDTGITAVSLDAVVPLDWAAENLQQNGFVVQGNLDPVFLLAGGDAMKRAVDKILPSLGQGSFIFNLGHGIHKDTPPQHVAELCELIRADG